jgi:hypothetical protein
MSSHGKALPPVRPAFKSTDVIEVLADGGVIRAICGIGGSYLAHHFEAAHHGLVSQG